MRDLKNWIKYYLNTYLRKKESKNSIHLTLKILNYIINHLTYNKNILIKDFKKL